MTGQSDGGLSDFFATLTSQTGSSGYTYTSVPADGYLGQAEGWIKNYVTLMSSYPSMKLIAYEGGQNFYATASGTCPGLGTLITAAERDPRMGTAYSDYLRFWQTNVGGADANVNNIFNDIYPFSSYGMWGLLESVMQPLTPIILRATQVSSRHEIYSAVIVGHAHLHRLGCVRYRNSATFDSLAAVVSACAVQQRTIRSSQAGKHIKDLFVAKDKAAVIEHQQRSYDTGQHAGAQAREVAIALLDMPHETVTLDHANQHESDKERQTHQSILERGSRIGIHDIDNALALPQQLHLRHEVLIPEIGMIHDQIPGGTWRGVAESPNSLRRRTAHERQHRGNPVP